MAPLEITPVATRADIREFVDLPWKVYAGDEIWVPPLKSHIRRLIDTKRHPFWEFAEQAMFLARRDSEVVGRIMGIVDRRFNAYQSERAASWGFFECENDRASAGELFRAVEDWARGKGMAFVRGPLCPSTNYETGMLIEGFDRNPLVMMPYNPPYYIDLVESAGYQKEKDLITIIVEHTDHASERIERLARRLERKNTVSVRPVTWKTIDDDVRLIADLYADCWADNWGFVPMSDGEIAEMARNLKQIFRQIGSLDTVVFLYYRDEPAGIVLVLPDINPLLKRLDGRLGLSGVCKVLLHRNEVVGGRGMLMGIKKQYQRLGLPIVVYHHMNQILRKHDYQYVEYGWLLEDNTDINSFGFESGGSVSKRYRIYRTSF